MEKKKYHLWDTGYLSCAVCFIYVLSLKIYCNPMRHILLYPLYTKQNSGSEDVKIVKYLTTIRHLECGRIAIQKVQHPFHYNSSPRNVELTGLQNTNKIAAKIYFYILKAMCIEMYL